jgi:hypothetical protein
LLVDYRTFILQVLLRVQVVAPSVEVTGKHYALYYPLCLLGLSVFAKSVKTGSEDCPSCMYSIRGKS